MAMSNFKNMELEQKIAYFYLLSRISDNFELLGADNLKGVWVDSEGSLEIKYGEKSACTLPAEPLFYIRYGRLIAEDFLPDLPDNPMTYERVKRSLKPLTFKATGYFRSKFYCDTLPTPEDVAQLIRLAVSDQLVSVYALLSYNLQLYRWTEKLQDAHPDLHFPVFTGEKDSGGSLKSEEQLLSRKIAEDCAGFIGEVLAKTAPNIASGVGPGLFEKPSLPIISDLETGAEMLELSVDCRNEMLQTERLASIRDQTFDNVLKITTILADEKSPLL